MDFELSGLVPDLLFMRSAKGILFRRETLESWHALDGHLQPTSPSEFDVRCGAQVPSWNQRATWGFWQAI